MNDVVKYRNELNTVPLRMFEESEMNILFAIVAEVKHKSVQEVTFSFDELREQCRYRPSSNATTLDFVKALQKTKDKLKKLSYEKITNGGLDIEDITLFPGFKILGTEKKLIIQVHPEFERIFNEFGIGFTNFNLLEFVTIQSIYAKTIYRLLKQFRTQGWWHVSLEDFRKLLVIPESYKASDIDKRVINPTLKQLGGTDGNAIFKNLKVEKIKKKGRGRGGVLTGYKFTFDKETTTPYVENKYAKQSKSKPAKKVETAQIFEDDAVWRKETPPLPKDQAEVNARIAKLLSSTAEKI